MSTSLQDDDAFYDELHRELEVRRTDHACDESRRLLNDIDAARLLLREAMPWMDEDSSIVQMAQAASVFLTRRHEVREQIDTALEEHAGGD